MNLCIAGVVILYHPKKNVIQSILSYIDQINFLFIIDNSQPSAKELLTDLLQRYEGKIKYIHNEQNEGIAKPLNQAAQLSLAYGANWMLTMDQDSFFKEGSIQNLIDHTYQNSNSSSGIFVPFHHTPNAKVPSFALPTKEVLITMTSGNLLSLDAYKKSGPFDEKLFIDSVDHEYCLRLRQNGFKIIRVNNSFLYHELGEIKYKRILFLKVKTTNHNPTRRYYMTRNRLYIMFRYMWFDFKFFRRELKHLILDFFKILFAESNKRAKLKSMLAGTRHFLKGI